MHRVDRAPRDRTSARSPQRVGGTIITVFTAVETGASTSVVAQPLLAFDRHGAVGVGAITAGVLFGSVLCLAWMGRSGDAHPHRTVITSALVVRLITTGGILVALTADAVLPWLLGVWAAVTAGSWSVIAPLQAPLLRSVLPEGAWAKAFAAVRVRSHVADIVGVAFGGYLYSWSASAPLVVDTLLCSAALVLNAVTVRTPAQSTTASSARPSWDGVREIVGVPGLRRCVLALALFSSVSYWPVCVSLGRSHGMTGGSLGLLAAALSAAGIIGALVSGVTVVVRRPRRVSAWCSLVVVVCLALFGVFFGRPFAYPFLLLATMAVFPCGLVLDLQQARCSSVDHLGRVMALVRLVVMMSAALGQAAGLALAQRSGAVAVFAFYGALVAVGAALLDRSIAGDREAGVV